MSAKNHIVSAGGTKLWFLGRKLHREDGPARIYPRGTREWYKNGLLHREDGPAVIHYCGVEEWYLNGILHRKDGPARDYKDGGQEWYLDGKLHREDGPAIVDWYADSYDQWWMFGRRVDQKWVEKYKKLTQNHRLLGVPVRDKWVTREIVLSWYHNPNLRCVQNRLRREYESLKNC